MEFDSWLNIDLYHAIDKNNPHLFTPRGNISITSINSGSFQLTQQHLNSNERSMFKELAEANKFYRLKAIVTYSNGAKTTFLTSSKSVRIKKTFNFKRLKFNNWLFRIFSVCFCQFSIERYFVDFGWCSQRAWHSTHCIGRWSFVWKSINNR